MQMNDVLLIFLLRRSQIINGDDTVKVKVISSLYEIKQNNKLKYSEA